MKKSILLLLLIFCCFCRQPEAKETPVSLYFNSIDSLSTLARLFGNAAIKGDEILWTPDYEDIPSFSNILSNDSVCHTQLDTVLKAGYSYFVVFRTDQYDASGKAGCHVCAPIVGIASFEKKGGQFQLKNFRKHVFQTGGFGEYGQLELSDLCVSAFKVTSGWTGTGADIQYEIYYDMDDFSKLFYLTTFTSNGGIFEKGQPEYYETVRTITDKTDTSFIIETKKTAFDSLGKKTEIRYKDMIKVINEVGGQELEFIQL